MSKETTNTEDLRAKSADELAKHILDMRKEQLNARFQKSQGSLENTAQIRKNRRDIARTKTILNELLMKERREDAKKSSGKKAA